MGKEGASNLVSLLSKSLEPVVDMHNNDCVICSCDLCLFSIPKKTLSDQFNDMKWLQKFNLPMP